MKASYWCTWTTFLYVFTESDTAVTASIFVVGIVAALASCAGICFCCICTCQRVKQIGSRWENTPWTYIMHDIVQYHNRYLCRCALYTPRFPVPPHQCSQQSIISKHVRVLWTYQCHMLSGKLMEASPGFDFERKRVTKRVYIWCAVQLCAGGWS